ncbi:MAG TPA: methyltransferase domain-containing protein [Desulfobulbus sp.]|nr:methyltransferase domain-containing protein [Desulfobulbus sp.]
MSLEILNRHRRIWQEKKILQRIYQNWYQLILKECRPQGMTLEIGGGGGNFKKFFPEVISSDYTLCPWLDLNLDAHNLPFAADSLANIVMIDVLHHLTRPLHFIEEAYRVLQEKGRLIMLEPCITPGSYLIYNFLHQEDLDFSKDLFKGETWISDDEKKPFDGNLAIPTQLFFRNAAAYKKKFSNFPIVQKKHSDYLVYPLSGGFDHPSVLPNSLVPFFIFLEKMLQPLGFMFAYRMLVVLEKNR